MYRLKITELVLVARARFGQKLGAVKNKKSRSLEICCSSRDCAIGKVGRKDNKGFVRLVGRAISDSTVIKAFCTK